MHSTTRAVTFTLTAERKGSQIEVSGDVPVLFFAYDIQNPSFAGFVTTQDHGLLDLLLISIGPNGTWLERPGLGNFSADRDLPGVLPPHPR